MSITMLTKGAEGHPRLYCDHCGNRILDPAMANAIYLSHPSAEGRLSEVMYVHRECDDPFQRENPTQGKYQWMWKAARPTSRRPLP